MDGFRQGGKDLKEAVLEEEEIKTIEAAETLIEENPEETLEETEKEEVLDQTPADQEEVIANQVQMEEEILEAGIILKQEKEDTNYLTVI